MELLHLPLLNHYSTLLVDPRSKWAHLILFLDICDLLGHLLLEPQVFSITHEPVLWFDLSHTLRALHRRNPFLFLITVLPAPLEVYVTLIMTVDLWMKCDPLHFLGLVDTLHFVNKLVFHHLFEQPSLVKPVSNIFDWIKLVLLQKMFPLSLRRGIRWFVLVYHRVVLDSVLILSRYIFSCGHCVQSQAVLVWVLNCIRVILGSEREFVVLKYLDTLALGILSVWIWWLIFRLILRNEWSAWPWCF